MKMGTTFIILGSSILAVLLAGYFAQKYLPPPKPKIFGVDLGTTYSCIGMYHAISGRVDILEVQDGHKCIPSVVAYSAEGILVGYKAVAQSEHNPKNTLYDAKRFIGKIFTRQELDLLQKRYPFKLEADEYGMMHYVVSVNGTERNISPELVGSKIIKTLRETAIANISAPVNNVVMSVPAEFNELQRNYTRKACNIADLEVLRIINEPTAAAMAYGLHQHPNMQTILVVDLGGGTLDVSILMVQGGMFLTQAMAGNSQLGGQDFNQRLLQYLLNQIKKQFSKPLTNKEDAQVLRNQVEEAKINLTNSDRALIRIKLHSFNNQIYEEDITRRQFEELNKDLFQKVLEPIKTALTFIELEKSDIDEIVLVGGSTRVPKVRQIIEDFFGKPPNTSVDPELAVATGVAIQAGIIGGMWPLTVSAVELETRVKKISLN